MQLKVKFLKWSSGIRGVMLNKKTAEEIGIHSFGRVEIKTLSKNPKLISTWSDTIRGSLKENEVVVSLETKKILGLRKGQKVDVNLAPASRSLEFIKKKLDNKKLSDKEIKLIISDVVSNSLLDSEIALFVSAMHKNGMDFKETISLINAILKTGNKLNFKNKIIVDKHSIGGVAGNRTTPLVVSICAAAGLHMPKTSSRAITSAAGTVDTIETIANVDFKVSVLKKIIKKTGAFMVWGGGLGMVPADSKIIKVEKILKIDPEAQLLASIMSKKLAVGSNCILIDIPYGKSAKVNRQGALNLKKKFKRLGKHFRKKMKVVLTDGSQPIGNGIGPALELRDIINILDQTREGPKDLEEKSIFLSGQIFEMARKTKKGNGEELAREILSSGKAFDKFKEIIKAQGGKVSEINLAKFKKDILSKKSGKIIEIDNKKINSLARSAGCPADKFSGLYLHKHVKEKIKKNEKLLTIYAESKARLNDAVRFYNKVKPIRIK